MFTLKVVKAFAAVLFVLCGVTLQGEVAQGVTPAQAELDASDASVTTGAAVRARADVQIRRIKSLIVSKSNGTDDDAAYEKLEKLQKELRGER